MIRLTYQQIRDPGFNPILDRLTKSPVSISTAKKIIEICEKLGEAQKRSDQLWRKVVEWYLEPIPGKEAEGLMRIKQSLSEAEKDEASKAIQEFLDTQVEINVNPLKESELMYVELRSVDYALIKDMVIP